MIKGLLVGIGIMGVIFLGWFFFGEKPLDIRNDYLKNKIQQADYKKGKALIEEMQLAYGGKANWRAYKTGTFIQRAEWYGRKKISGWDTIPQLYEMTSYFGDLNNCELILLNGENKGKKWGMKEGKFYTQKEHQDKVFEEHKHHKDKLIFKNYWFQFPFLVGDAEIIAYAGEIEVNGTLYELVYATWGSEKPNKTYDQFILYLNKQTKLVEYLHFTVRDKFKGISFSARFTDFKKVKQLTFPFAQYVTQGSPQKEGVKMHENLYEEIHLGVINH